MTGWIVTTLRLAVASSLIKRTLVDSTYGQSCRIVFSVASAVSHYRR